MQTIFRILLNALINLAIIVPNSFGQITKDLKFGFGVGPNLSTFTGSGDNDRGWVPGVRGGFYVQKPLENGVIVEPGLYYSNVGSRSTHMTYNENTFEEVEQKERFLLSYLNVPVVARYKVSSNVSVFAGPQVSFLVGGKKKLKYSGEKEKVDAKDEFKTVSAGVSMGAAYEFEGGERLQLSVNPGFTNNSKSEGGYGGSEKSRIFSFALLFNCPLE